MSGPIAKNVYVAPRTGWFSCRTALLSRRGQTGHRAGDGWSKFVPSGEGVLAFSKMEECVDALDRVAADLGRHREAAFEIAREYVAADRVLPPMIETIFASERVLPPGKPRA